MVPYHCRVASHRLRLQSFLHLMVYHSMCDSELHLPLPSILQTETKILCARSIQFYAESRYFTPFNGQIWNVPGAKLSAPFSMLGELSDWSRRFRVAGNKRLRLKTAAGMLLLWSCEGSRQQQTWLIGHTSKREQNCSGDHSFVSNLIARDIPSRTDLGFLLLVEFPKHSSMEPDFFPYLYCCYCFYKICLPQKSSD